MISGMLPRVAIPIDPHAVQSMTMPRVFGRSQVIAEVTLHRKSFAEL